MLERFLELKTAISVNVSDVESTLSFFMESLIHLLKPFEELTKRISSNKSIISEVIPAIMILDTFLNRPNTSHFGVGTTKDVILGCLLKRFEKVIKYENLIIATFLDPWFKLLFFKPENKQTVKKIILNILSSFNNLNSNIEEPTNNTSTVETLNAAENRESLWDFYKEITSKSIPTEAPGSLNYSVLDDYHSFNRVLLVVEFEKYCNMKCISIDDDPLSWWKIHFESLPLIENKLLIQKYLSAPASSVYSKRSFSVAGLVYEAKSNRLQPQNAEQLLFVHHYILVNIFFIVL